MILKIKKNFVANVLSVVYKKCQEDFILLFFKVTKEKITGLYSVKFRITLDNTVCQWPVLSKNRTQPHSGLGQLTGV